MSESATFSHPAASTSSSPRITLSWAGRQIELNFLISLNSTKIIFCSNFKNSPAVVLLWFLLFFQSVWVVEGMCTCRDPRWVWVEHRYVLCCWHQWGLGERENLLWFNIQQHCRGTQALRIGIIYLFLFYCLLWYYCLILCLSYRYQVMRCDYGNMVKLHISNLRPLPPSFIGSFALECTLTDIRFPSLWQIYSHSLCTKHILRDWWWISQWSS